MTGNKPPQFEAIKVSTNPRRDDIVGQAGSFVDDFILAMNSEGVYKNMGILHDKPNMYAIMMSNFPKAFDEASIRAGRIDKRYEFLLPNQEERKSGYDHAIEKLNERARYKVVRGYDSLGLAELSDGYSYADIVESVNASVKKRAQEISKTREKGTLPNGYVSQKRLEEAVNFHRKSFYTAKRKMGFT